MTMAATFRGVPAALMEAVGQDPVYIVPGSVSYADGVLQWRCQAPAPEAVMTVAGLRREAERLVHDPSVALGYEVMSVTVLGALHQSPYLVCQGSVRVVAESNASQAEPDLWARWEGAGAIGADRVLLAMSGGAA